MTQNFVSQVVTSLGSMELSMYKGNIGTVWNKKLWMKTWYTSKLL